MYVACLSQNDFERLLGPLEEILLEAARGSRTTKLGVDSSGGVALRKDIRMTELKTLGLLGTGGFGMVTLVKRQNTSETFALKQMAKAYVVKCKMQKSIMHEKNIQMLCDSDFIVRLYATFKDADNVYLLLEPVLGGELYHT